MFKSLKENENRSLIQTICELVQLFNSQEESVNYWPEEIENKCMYQIYKNDQEMYNDMKNKTNNRKQTQMRFSGLEIVTPKEFLETANLFKKTGKSRDRPPVRKGVTTPRPKLDLNSSFNDY